MVNLLIHGDKEEERIRAGYIYNENYDKPKDVTYFIRYI